MGGRRIYGVAGWLFADMMLIFLIMATSAEPGAAPKPTTTPSPSASLSPSPFSSASGPPAPSPTTTPGPAKSTTCGGLQLPLVSFNITIPQTQNPIQRDQTILVQVTLALNQNRVSRQRAGLVLAFGTGNSVPAGIIAAETANNAIKGHLEELKQLPDDLLRSYFTGGPPNQVQYQWFLANSC